MFAAVLDLERGEMVAIHNGILSKVHRAEHCLGPHCWVHNPSTHHMCTWPVEWSANERTAQRICQHGLSHPDPDDVAFHQDHGRDVTMHDCDGCCIGVGVPYARQMEDLVTPAELARELQITQRRVRDYLRERYGTLRPPVTRWHLDASQAREVRNYFRGGRA